MLPFLAKLVVHDPYRLESVWQSFGLSRDEYHTPVCEWWNVERKITLYVVEGHGMRYVKVWGDNMDTDMEDGRISSLEEFMPLWDWLHHDHPKVDDLSWARSGIDD